MKLRNYSKKEWHNGLSGEKQARILSFSMTHLQERILILRFQLVRSEDLVTTLRLFIVETAIVALEEFEDIVDEDCFQVDFLLIVQVFCLEFYLSR